MSVSAAGIFAILMNLLSLSWQLSVYAHRHSTLNLVLAGLNILMIGGISYTMYKDNK